MVLGKGCPLSPFLLAIAIEPLAVALRSSQMQVILKGSAEHKLVLYADDLGLFVFNPDRWIPPCAGYHWRILGKLQVTNDQNSELMPINTAAAFYSLANLPFKESLSDFKY